MPLLLKHTYHGACPRPTPFLLVFNLSVLNAFEILKFNFCFTAPALPSTLLRNCCSWKLSSISKMEWERVRRNCFRQFICMKLKETSSFQLVPPLTDWALIRLLKRRKAPFLAQEICPKERLGREAEDWMSELSDASRFSLRFSFFFVFPV